MWHLYEIGYCNRLAEPIKIETEFRRGGGILTSDGCEHNHWYDHTDRLRLHAVLLQMEDATVGICH